MGLLLDMNELHHYDVPKTNETFVSDVVIDLGSESRITIDYKKI